MGARKEVKTEKYLLKCLGCGREYPEDHLRLNCDESHAPSLLRTAYQQRTIRIKDNLPGVFKYSDWLPVNGSLNVTGAPVTYRSVGFARELGLSNLFISFNGYWPERNAFIETCSFKHLEALPTVVRFIENGKGRLVVASAGNTARAFAYACSVSNLPLCLVVPESALEFLWLPIQPKDCVELIVLGNKCDYTDAITVANRLSEQEGFTNEGGVLNVARRDGMGTVVVDATLSIGDIPDHYFQAVGSGTGAISAWEANLRFIESGKYGNKKMRLHLAQNHPFTPIYESWKTKSKEPISLDGAEAKKRLRQVDAKVLSNRKPPYSIIGGVYDALMDTQGEMYSVTNQELRAAKGIFERLEGIDICAEAGVAVAALAQAIKQGSVDREDKILLNITGGGFERLKKDRSLHYLQPDVVIDNPEADISNLLKKLKH